MCVNFGNAWLTIFAWYNIYKRPSGLDVLLDILPDTQSQQGLLNYYFETITIISNLVRLVLLLFHASSIPITGKFSESYYYGCYLNPVAITFDVLVDVSSKFCASCRSDIWTWFLQSLKLIPGRALKHHMQLNPGNVRALHRIPMWIAITKVSFFSPNTCRIRLNAGLFGLFLLF